MKAEGRTAFLCKLTGINFDTREVTLRAWNSTPAIGSGFYVVVSQAEWNELRDCAAIAMETGTAIDSEAGVVAKP